MKQLRTQLNTIFLTVGPSGCGKTTFVKQKIHELQQLDSKLRIHHLSSDNIRQEILGESKSFDIFHPRMLQVSQQAFELLFAKLKALLSFPVVADFVFVDTTGLSLQFREKIQKIANENHYNLDLLLFSYKDRKLYLKYLDRPIARQIAQRHITKLHNRELKQLKTKYFTHSHRIASWQFDEYRFEVLDLSLYQQTRLSSKYAYTVIGDVHACLDELKELLQTRGFVIDSNNKLTHPDPLQRIVLLGDVIDKGPQIAETIHFIFDNKELIFFIKGNHENFVAKWLRDEITKTNVPAEALQYFDSIKILEKDKLLQERFLRLVDEALPFVWHDLFFASHAPAPSKFLGKLDSKGKRHQRNFVYPKRRDFTLVKEHLQAVESKLSFLQREQAFNFPTYIVGHVPVTHATRVGNVVMLDTGCVEGNRLSAVYWHRDRLKVTSVVSRQSNHDGQIFRLFDKKSFVSSQDLDWSQLTSRDLKQIKYCAEHKINFISGTMAPSDRDLVANKLESVATGLDYYQRKGIKKVILQPKYMGSRCNIYLFKNIKKCFAVSRRGHIIQPSKVNLTPVFTRLIKQFADDWVDYEMILLDGELLPWIAMGKNLIERDFITYQHLVEQELLVKKASHFDTHLLAISKEMPVAAFSKDSHNRSKKELRSLYPGVVYETVKSLSNYLQMHTQLTTDQALKAHHIYRKQLEIYAQKGTLEFKGFSILKRIRKDKTEEILVNEHYSNIDIFSQISPHEPHLILELTDPQALEQAQSFFETLVSNSLMEGVVIKPEQVYQEGVAPFIKVRNHDYLTIVYGYDYRHEPKHARLLSRKRIGRKLRTSIKEWQLNKALLEIPFAAINDENQDYRALVAQLIAEQRKEEAIDPRL